MKSVPIREYDLQLVQFSIFNYFGCSLEGSGLDFEGSDSDQDLSSVMSEKIQDDYLKKHNFYANLPDLPWVSDAPSV